MSLHYLVELHYKQFSLLHESIEVYLHEIVRRLIADINIAIGLAAYERCMERDQEELHFHKPKVGRSAHLAQIIQVSGRPFQFCMMISFGVGE